MIRLALFIALLTAACSGPQTPTATQETLAPPPPSLPGVRDDDLSELAGAGIDIEAIRCNGLNSWELSLRSRSKAGAHDVLELVQGAGVAVTPEQQETLHDELTDFLMWRYVRAIIISGNQNNLGVVPLNGVKRADGSPLLVFRSAFTPDPDVTGSCYQSLIQAAKVRHVVNLYDGEIPTADLEAAERASVESAGGTYDTVRDAGGDIAGWRDLLRKHGDDPEAQARAEAAVAELINTRILAPSGTSPQGNVHIHCGGGMHRTGMVIGVLERCINNTPMEEITEAYRHHVSWQSPEVPGGAEPENLEFIESFDCSLLNR